MAGRVRSGLTQRPINYSYHFPPCRTSFCSSSLIGGYEGYREIGPKKPGNVGV